MTQIGCSREAEQLVLFANTSLSLGTFSDCRVTPEDVAGHAGPHSPDREADLQSGVVPGGDAPVRPARSAFRAGPEALPHSNEYPCRSQDAQYRYGQDQNDQDRRSARDRGSPTPARDRPAPPEEWSLPRWEPLLTLCAAQIGPVVHSATPFPQD
jgi:hypothetical protein